MNNKSIIALTIGIIVLAIGILCLVFFKREKMKNWILENIDKKTQMIILKVYVALLVSSIAMLAIVGIVCLVIFKGKEIKELFKDVREKLTYKKEKKNVYLEINNLHDRYEEAKKEYVKRSYENYLTQTDSNNQNEYMDVDRYKTRVKQIRDEYGTLREELSQENLKRVVLNKLEFIEIELLGIRMNQHSSYARQNAFDARQNIFDSRQNIFR